MTDLRQAAQQALEALQNCANGEDDVLLTRDALAALRAALAEPVQESDDKAASIRWQLCLLAQTEEFSDDVRNQIGRGVWLIDRLRAELAEPQEPVARLRVNSNVPGRINELDLLRPLPRGELFLYAVPPQHPAEPVQEPVRLQCTTCGTVYADGVPPQVPVREPVAWDGRCMLGHCNSPAGCENSGECRAVERAHWIGGEG